MIVHFEVLFFPVGDGGRSGDAIALRYWNGASWVVGLIDAGYDSNAEAIIRGVRDYFGTHAVNFAIATHLDADHLNGFKSIITSRELRLGQLAVHQPWLHTEGTSSWYEHPRVTDRSLFTRLLREEDTARALVESAHSLGIEVLEPFYGVGTRDGYFRIIGPQLDYYESLVPQLRSTPEPSAALLALWANQPPAQFGLPAGRDLARATGAFNPFAVACNQRNLGLAIPELLATGRDVMGPAPAPAMFEAILRRLRHAEVLGDLSTETLDDDEDTSGDNATSVISVLSVDGTKLLFTGDATPAALSAALDTLDGEGFDYRQLAFVQPPHHGSERNLTPRLLDRLLLHSRRGRTAIVSCSEASEEYPSPKVVNSLMHRGVTVYATRGRTVRWGNAPRAGFTPIPAETFTVQIKE